MIDERWQEMSGKGSERKNKKREHLKHGWRGKYGYLQKYSLIFAVLCVSIFSPFLLTGKSLIWETDGATQYYPYLQYMGRFLRTMFRDFLSGDFSLQMYDFSLGMGDDVGKVFRSHPLDFFSAAVPSSYTELLYQLLTLLRMYLAGLSFSCFCFYMRGDRNNEQKFSDRPLHGYAKMLQKLFSCGTQAEEENFVLLGSVIYVFSGYVLVQAIRHPTFLAPMIVFPLLLIGTEQILRGCSGLLFSFMTAMGFLSNYYFMYVCSIAMACYVIFRFAARMGEVHQKKEGEILLSSEFRVLFLTGVRLCGSYLLGLGMAAAVLFPMLQRMMSSSRLGETGVDSLLLYPWERYYRWFLNLISPVNDTGYNTNLNYGVFVIPALILLFTSKWKEHWMLKVSLILQILGMLIPAAAFCLSGFSNINNRWIFVFSFTLSFSCVAAAETVFKIKKKQLLCCLAVTIVYLGLAISFGRSGTMGRYWLIGGAELLLSMILLCLLQKCRLSMKRREQILLGLVCCSVIVNGWLLYDENHGNAVEDYLEQGEALDYYADSRWKRLKKIEDTEFYRTDSNQMSSGKENASVILGTFGISMYNSILNGSELEYLLDLESPGVNAVHRIFSMEGRTVPSALANVRYYLTSTEEQGNVPYGFEKNEALSDETYQIYQNRYPLSVGYTYDAYIQREDYEQLTPLEKQQIMLDAVVIEEVSDEEGAEDSTAENLQQIREYSKQILTVPAELPQQGENISVSEKGYKVSGGKGSLLIPYERKAGYECYLCLDGFYRDVSASGVDIITTGVKTRITLRGKTKNYSLGRTDYTVNLGFSEENGSDTIQILFTQEGTYELAQASLCYVPMDGYEEKIAARSQSALENVVISKNKVSGTATVTDNKFMVFSIPYSTGWSVCVDGEEVPVQKANVMYLGVTLEPGEHTIELCYTTPGVTAGIWITVISWGIFAAALFWHWRAVASFRSKRPLLH